jgi:phenylacetate-coenzyme A ligase PaaK-like adenylate-forming protein
VNVFPQAVDDVVFAQVEVDEYEVLLTSDGAMADVATVRVMPKAALGERGDAFRTALEDSLRRKIGIRIGVELVAELPRSEYKARRWRDERVR